MLVRNTKTASLASALAEAYRSATRQSKALARPRSVTGAAARSRAPLLASTDGTATWPTLLPFFGSPRDLRAFRRERGDL